jgi:hypothetical protein
VVSPPSRWALCGLNLEAKEAGPFIIQKVPLFVYNEEFEAKQKKRVKTWMILSFQLELIETLFSGV